MKLLRALALTIIPVMSLTSCASIVNGTNQSVSVNTGKVSGASCKLKNNKGTWFIPSTPGSTVVNRSYGDMIVNCTKPNYIKGHKVVASKTKGMAFGNAVFGGVIGAGVDMADGAAYDYPNNIYVPMKQAHKG